MDKITKQEFWKLIEPEIVYYNKTWAGRTRGEQSENQAMILKMYFDALKHASPKTIESALNQHRQAETTFPKIAQLLRYCPKPFVNENPNPKAVSIPENLKERIEAAKSGGIRKHLSDKEMLDMKALCRVRWPGDWSDVFARWDAENENLRILKEAKVAV